ncbi:HET domain-containing protein [Fusarium keratoplasticum]|uniref:HET domain-containing protein n=1 Tax=Fusarium keratoplasticum TaxID=1328300 RepID=A0ACC0QEW2_9HYPO|nr:HET domain-containing protein [Fusarium keratoplasticum]KAI8652412.1 HET domain-containing protein [Fusarium keratoplasticum]
MSRHEEFIDRVDLGGLDLEGLPSPPAMEPIDEQPTADGSNSGTASRNEETADFPNDSPESDKGRTSYYTGGNFYLKRRECILLQDNDSDSGADQPTILRPESIFLAIDDDKILELGRLPSLVDQPDEIRQLASNIIKGTMPLSEERAVRLGYLSDQCLDLSELLKRCDDALEKAFEAADAAVWTEAGGSSAEVAEVEENAVNVGDQGTRSDETPASSQDSTEKSNEAPGEPEQGSYCCYVALTMAARVLKAPSAQKMLEAIREGADLDDLILNIECFRPPTESEPWEPDMPDKQGYGHIYALLGCLMATAYARQCYAVETIYLDRAISNLDVAILKIPESPFKEFREYLQRFRQEVGQIQVLFQRIELEDDPLKNGVFCAICLDLKPIVGFHETEYPSHKMNFSKLCRNASVRCRVCTLLRDATASLYPLLDTSWEDIAEISYENRSVGRRWYDGEVDDVAELIWGFDGALQIHLHCHYMGCEESSICSFELYHLPETTRPWDIIGTGTHVCAEANSPESWDVVHGWIQQCVHNHDECRRGSEDRPFPTRILDVGSKDINPRLCVPSSDERGKYAALSHCWGDVMPLKTTKGTIDEFCRGIDLSKFPQTFKDAIVACQKLQIRYLWIDSLCIVQDDEDDWAVQSPKMSDVYQNAYITIAAAAARNSTEGCFHSRPFSIRKSFAAVAEVQNKVEQVEVFARPWQSDRHWTTNIGDGPQNRAQNPLETRAWTLQEHILSGRILRFTSHELVWHCREVHLCECRPGSALRKEALRLINLDRMTGDKDSSFVLRSSDPRIVWSEVVTPFTRRAITHESDRLPAISGVAAALAGPMGMEYIGGMWKGMLGSTVCWHVDELGTSRRETYYAPTWSWASVVGSVEAVWNASTNELPQTEVVDVQYSLATPNPYGRLSSARLTIKGLLLDVCMKSPDDLQAKDKSRNISFQMQFLNKSVTETDMKLEMICLAFPDIVTTSGEAPELRFGEPVRLLLLACKVYGQGFDSMPGLLLTEAPDVQNDTGGLVYRRVGMGEVKLRTSDRDQGEFRGKFKEGLGLVLANHLAAQGCLSTVTIV